MKLRQVTITFFLFLATIVVLSTPGLSQQTNHDQRIARIDTLLKRIEKNDFKKPDSVMNYARVAINLSLDIGYKQGEARAYYLLGNHYYNNYVKDSATKYIQMSISKYEDLSDSAQMAHSYLLLASEFFNESNYTLAKNMAHKALNIYLQKEMFEDAATSMSLLCDVYNFIGQNEMALQYCYSAYNLYDSLDITKNKYNLLNGLGVIYIELKQFSKAREMIQEAMHLALQSSDMYAYSTSLTNMGDFHLGLEAFDSAIYYYKKALQIDQQEQDSVALGYSHYNLGHAYAKTNELDLATSHLLKALKCSEHSIDMEMLATIYSELGNVFSKSKNYTQAVIYLKKGLMYAQKIDSDPLLRNSYNTLAKYYDRIGDKENALAYLKLYILHSEKMFNQKSAEKIAQAEVLFDLEMKERQIDLLKKDADIQSLRDKERKLVIMGLMTAFFGIIVFTIIIFKRYDKENKTNRILEVQKEAIDRQKNQISEKNRQITDSIRYAERVQQSLLPDINKLKKQFTDVFLLHKPKDIVSGDFVWYHQSQDSIFFAVIDCTGHGVPAAFMTVLSSTILNHLAVTHHHKQPHELISKLDAEIQHNLHLAHTEDLSPDGLDIALCKIDSNKSQLEYAGAKIPLYLCKDGKYEYLEPGRSSIGTNFYVTKQYNSIKINISEGDVILISTDGYQDQVGGADNKKFMKANFKKLVAKAFKLPFSKQCEKFESTFETWQGTEDQTDDVLLLAIKV